MLFTNCFSCVLADYDTESYLHKKIHDMIRSRLLKSDIVKNKGLPIFWHNYKKLFWMLNLEIITVYHSIHRGSSLTFPHVCLTWAKVKRIYLLITHRMIVLLSCVLQFYDILSPRQSISLLLVIPAALNIVHLTIPWSRVCKLYSPLIKKFLAFYGTQRLVTVFTGAR
jgi:hypothetical protein